MKLASTTSSTAKTTAPLATMCISKDMQRQAFMHAHFLKDDYQKMTSITSAVK